jgi:effector-binding domain-containing protein
MKKSLAYITVGILLLISTGFSQQKDGFQIVEKESFPYVYLGCQGPMGKMPAEISRFIPLFFQQGLQPSGPLLTVYTNSPEEVSEEHLQWRVGFPVASEVTVQAPLKTDRYRKKKVLEYLHKGSYEELPDIYLRIQSYLEENKIEYVLPTYEFYLNDPSQVKPAELLTRIEIPIKE